MPRKLVYGVGTNDAAYAVQPKIDGRQQMCPYYRVWRNMLGRVYRESELIRYPTYRGCSVAEAWLSFMAFKTWMEKQDWKGKQLDKDLKYPGNTVYSSGTCLFVSSEINHLLLSRTAVRGKYPQGVSRYRTRNTFLVGISIFGKNKFLGYFSTPEEAGAAYVKAKAAHIRNIASQQADVHLARGLLRHAQLLEESIGGHR